MDLTEKTLDSREVFRGRIIRVRQDTVRLPNGKEGTREVVEHPGGVAVLAIDDLRAVCCWCVSTATPSAVC